MREDLIAKLRRKADSTVESPAPHLTGDMKFYVYDAETRELLSEAAAALEAAREDAWQPIETAPKDGELILVCRLGETSTWPAWWRQRETFNLRDRNGWHSKENAPLKFNPTHWRPLPAPLSAPPAIDQARGKGEP